MLRWRARIRFLHVAVWGAVSFQVLRAAWGCDGRNVRLSVFLSLLLVVVVAHIITGVAPSRHGLSGGGPCYGNNLQLVAHMRCGEAAASES